MITFQFYMTTIGWRARAHKCTSSVVEEDIEYEEHGNYVKSDVLDG